MAGLKFHTGQQFKALLMVRRRLSLRPFAGHEYEIIATIMVGLALLSGVIAAAAVSWVGYTRAPGAWPGEILLMVLSLVWIIWLVYPAIFSPFNDAIDLSRLLTYPIPTRTLVSAFLTGSIFDFSSILTIPLLVAALAAWAGGPEFLLVLLTLVIAYLHMVIIGQLVANIFSGIFRSRRFRDAAIVIGTLVGLGLWSAQFWFNRGESSEFSLSRDGMVAGVLVSDYLKWFPPGAAGKAIVSAHSHQWASAMQWLGYCLTLLIALTWSWWRILRRASTQGGAFFALPEQPGATRSQDRKQRELLKWLPLQTRELVKKELRLVWRAPRRRMALTQTIVMPIVMCFALLYEAPSHSLYGFIPVAFATFASLTLFSNVLGIEGAGFTALLLSPVPRERIFRAKMIAPGLIMAIPLLLATAVATWISGDAMTVMGLAVGTAVAMSSMFISCFMSVAFPYRVPEDGKRQSLTKELGLAPALIMMLLGPSGMAILSAPAWGFFLAGALLGSQALMLLGGMAGAVITVALLWIAPRVAARFLGPREIDIPARLQLGKLS